MGAVSIGRVVRDVLFPISTKFVIWHCGDSLDIGEFVVRRAAMWQHVLDTNDNLQQSLLAQGLTLAQGILRPREGRNHFVLLSWDPDFNTRCARVLYQVWRPASLTSGPWIHLMAERPKRLIDSSQEA